MKDETRNWTLYGPTGVTGRLILAEALARGHRPQLAGRPSAGLRALARETGLPWQEIGLEDGAGLRAMLSSTFLILHAAGPYALTGPPMLSAVLDARTHYVDVNGEPEFLDALLASDATARVAGVMLLGGAGFGVTVGEGLAAHVAHRLAKPVRWVRLGVAPDTVGRSAAAGESRRAVLKIGGRRIVGGQPVACPLADVTWGEQDPHGGRVRFAAMPLAELIPAARATGAGEVTVGVPMGWLAARAIRGFAPWLLPIMDRLRRSTPDARAAFGDEPPPTARPRVSRVWATAGAGDGTTASARFETGEGYAFAARAAVRAVEAVLAGGGQPGAWTPTAAFGASFLPAIGGVRIVDLVGTLSNHLPAAHSGQ